MSTFLKWILFTCLGAFAILSIGFFMIADSFDIFANLVDFLQQFPILYEFTMLFLVLMIFLLIALGVGLYLILKRIRKYDHY